MWKNIFLASGALLYGFLAAYQSITELVLISPGVILAMAQPWQLPQVRDRSIAPTGLGATQALGSTNWWSCHQQVSESQAEQKQLSASGRLGGQTSLRKGHLTSWLILTCSRAVVSAGWLQFVLSASHSGSLWLCHGCRLAQSLPTLGWGLLLCVYLPCMQWHLLAGGSLQPPTACCGSCSPKHRAGWCESLTSPQRGWNW